MNNIPIIGIGTNLHAYKSEDISQLLPIIDAGLKLGYTYIDTGDIVDQNTIDIFQRLDESKIRRDKVFISTRVYDYTTPEDFKLRIGKLGHIDLCNFGNVPITTSRNTFNTVALKIWSGMIQLKESGLVKHLGIINFHYHQAEIFFDLVKSKELELPTIAYIEIHPLNLQERLVQFYRSHGLQIIAYSPLGSNGHDIYKDHEVIEQIRVDLGAENYIQAILATTLARGITVIPKTLNQEHLAQNLKALQYVDKVTQVHIDLLADINLESPLNNNTSNAIIANNRLI
jgi:alcohol dehydrogenase (NADP+)